MSHSMHFLIYCWTHSLIPMLLKHHSSNLEMNSALGHTHRQWLNSSTMTDDVQKGPNSGIDAWMCLSEYPAGVFCLWDAANPDSEGYIRDGASVFVGISGRTIVEITSGGLIRLDDWNPSIRSQTGVKPLKFVYKTIGIVER